MSTRLSPLALWSAAVLLIFLLALAPSPTKALPLLGSPGGGHLLQSTFQPPPLDTEQRIRLAFPGFEPGRSRVDTMFPGRAVDRDFDTWPIMRYLGDSAHVAGKTFTLLDVRLVPGKSYPLVYEPATGIMKAAPSGLRTNLFDFSKNTGVFIPPETTLVMVELGVEPDATEPPPGVPGCRSQMELDYSGILRLSAQNLGETQVLLTDRDENFGAFSSPRIYCLSDGWVYFHVSATGIEPRSFWFEIIDGAMDPSIALWTLAPPP